MRSLKTGSEILWGWEISFMTGCDFFHDWLWDPSNADNEILWDWGWDPLREWDISQVRAWVRELDPSWLKLASFNTQSERAQANLHMQAPFLYREWKELAHSFRILITLSLPLSVSISSRLTDELVIQSAPVFKSTSLDKPTSCANVTKRVPVPQKGSKERSVIYLFFFSR